MTMVSQKMTTPIGYNQANEGKRISLKCKMLPIQKITKCTTAHIDSFPDTELIARHNQDRSDTCKDSMNDNYR
jgi:hypothetical protein